MGELDYIEQHFFRFQIFQILKTASYSHYLRYSFCILVSFQTNGPFLYRLKYQKTREFQFFFRNIERKHRLEIDSGASFFLVQILKYFIYT